MSAQVIKLGEGYYFLKITELMTFTELSEIWEEILFLSYRSKFQLDTSTARNENGELRSNKVGIWLDDVYLLRKFSNYFKYYKKWISDEAISNLLSTSLYWREFTHTKTDNTLFSYYEDGKYYDEHEDTSRLTQLFWTFKQPKKFNGGRLVFTDFNYEIDIEDNTMILFPSWFKHKVTPVILEEKTPENREKFLCNGRYVFTTFYN